MWILSVQLCYEMVIPALDILLHRKPSEGKEWVIHEAKFKQNTQTIIMEQL